MYTGPLVEYQMGEWLQVGGPSAVMVRYGHSRATGPLLAMVRLQPWYDGDPAHHPRNPRGRWRLGPHRE